MEGTASLDNSMLVPLSKALSVALVIIGVAGVAESIKGCVIGAAEACEIKPELGGALISISMAGASLIMTLLSCFLVINTEVKNFQQAGLSIAGGFILGFSIYFGSRALGEVSRHGLPAQARQKKFSTFLWFCILVAEIISMFGLLMAIMTFNAAGKAKTA